MKSGSVHATRDLAVWKNLVLGVFLYDCSPKAAVGVVKPYGIFLASAAAKKERKESITLRTFTL